MRKKLFIVLLVAAFCQMAYAGGVEGDYRQAVRLYERGLYQRASDIFTALCSENPDQMNEGYRVLCSINLDKDGYESEIKDYLDEYVQTPLTSSIRYLYGKKLFDSERYSEAKVQFSAVSKKDIASKNIPELLFKTAYCSFETGDYDAAKPLFLKVSEGARTDFTAPSRYALGYIEYNANAFSEAFDWFSLSSKDARFEQVSKYYMLECSFMLKDYKYVTSNAEALYKSAPEERKMHLARIISESYLVTGNISKAKEYFDAAGLQEGVQNRSDLFYAGSLQYSLGNYQKAIDNFTQMTDRADSIGQIASYQLGYSYIQTKNKVAAMSSFKEASSLNYDEAIREDAFFNFAKLSFDLNHDPSQFKNYLSTYSSTDKKDQIYDYIAVASLFNRDYAAAVEAYDNIDNLTPSMKSNYMKANFLKAAQLISNGSYRDAITYLRAATFFTDRQNNFNKFARYWLAESYYKTENYTEAGKILTDLYNTSALDNKQEGRLIPYNLGYLYFQQGEYGTAQKWFDVYSESGDRLCREDALTRSADCSFLEKDYQSAADRYSKVTSAFPSSEDLYPYYRMGLSYGLVGKISEEIEALSAARSSSPKAPFYSETMYELGRANVSQKKPDDAISDFETIVNTSPDSSFVAKSLIELGMIERNRKNYDGALKYYKSVCEQFPGTQSSEDALLALESIYQSIGEPDQYFAYVENLGKPARSEVEKEDIFFNTAQQFFLSENYDKALTSFEKYLKAYPNGSKAVEAYYDIAESYKALGKKEKACTSYARVANMAESGAFAESAMLNFAKLSYDLERYSDSYGAYSSLLETASSDNNRHSAMSGMLRSAFKAKDYDNALKSSRLLLADATTDARLTREARYIQAKSYLATSRRSEAYDIFRILSKEPSTDEGAESTYLIIQDTYDKGDFESIEELVYRFASAAPDQSYWLAKSYVVLGDSFVENDKVKQAKATFESLRDGYKPASGTSDEITEAIRMRLEKLNELSE